MANGDMSSLDYQAMSTIDYMSDISVAMINAASSDKERKEAQKHAEQMALEAYQRDTEFWERQQEYNSPEEKRKRLEAAGISPWTEYGQMTTEAPMIKSPVAETLPPLPGFQMPKTNMFQNYMQIKRMHNENKLLESSLQKQAAETRMKDLEASMAEFYIENQMENDAAFTRAEQGQAKIEWIQLKERHNESMNQLRNSIEQYNYEKSRRGYDEKYKNALLEKLRGDIESQSEQIKIYRQQAENLKSEFNIKDADLKDKHLRIEDLKNANEYNRVKRAREISLYEQGIDPNDPWYIRKLGNFKNWIDENTQPKKGIKWDEGTQSFHMWNPKLKQYVPLHEKGSIKDSNQFEK